MFSKFPFKPSFRQALIIAFTLFVSLIAFQNHQGNKVKEHLSITNEHERNCQLLYFSNQTGIEKRIAFFDPDIRSVHNWLRKPALEKKGFRITEVSFKSRYPYKHIFEQISLLEANGWEIVGSSMAALGYDELTDSRFSQILMVRDKN